MTEAATELDLTVLVGEMPANACESENHDSHPDHADGNEQYVMFLKPCGHDAGVQVLCMKSIQTIMSFRSVYCLVAECGWSLPPMKVVKVLGPANK